MNSTQLSTLLAVIDEGSFEVAAAVLGVSPSAVSQRIKALEADVGRVLIRRTTPPEATDAGAVVVQAARRMELLEAETRQALSGRLERVPLSIAVNADSLATWFRPVLGDVASMGSAVLRLRIEDESKTLRLLRSGDVLGAVTHEPRPVSGCEVHALGTMVYLPVAAPEVAERFELPGGGYDFARMPTLRFGPADMVQDSDLKGRVPRGAIIRRGISHIPSSEAFPDAVRMGLGWALIPRAQARPLLESGEVIQLDDCLLKVPLYWQRWRLESTLLGALTGAVIAASASGLE